MVKTRIRKKPIMPDFAQEPIIVGSAMLGYPACVEHIQNGNVRALCVFAGRGVAIMGSSKLSPEREQPVILVGTSMVNNPRPVWHEQTGETRFLHVYEDGDITIRGSST